MRLDALFHIAAIEAAYFLNDILSVAVLVFFLQSTPASFLTDAARVECFPNVRAAFSADQVQIPGNSRRLR